MRAPRWALSVPEARAGWDQGKGVGNYPDRTPSGTPGLKFPVALSLGGKSSIRGGNQQPLVLRFVLTEFP